MLSLGVMFEDFSDSIRKILINPRFSIVIICLMVLGKLVFSTGADPDLFARIAAGRLFFRDQMVSTQDPFSFTPKKDIWIDHEWLSGAVFFKLTQIGGGKALYVFSLSAVATTLLLLFSASFLRFKRVSLFLLSLLIIWGLDSTYLWASIVRSQIFTYLFIAFFYYLFIIFEEKKSLTYLLVQPLIMIFWCNAHGGFVLGIIMQLFFSCRIFLKERRGGIFLLPLISVLVTLINPYGIDYWVYIIDALTMHRAGITEWQPTYPDSLSNIIPYASLFLFLIGWKIKEPKNFMRYIIASEILLYSYFALRHQRMTALLYFSLIALGTSEINSFGEKISEYLSDFSLKIGRVFSTVVIAGLFVVLIRLAIFSASFWDFKLNFDSYPSKAVTWLEQKGSGGRLLTDFNVGSYALWRLYPKYQISLDGRYEEVYPDSTVQTVSVALTCNQNGAQLAALQSLAPDYIITNTDNRCFLNHEKFTDLWQEVYRDSKWSVFGRGKMAYADGSENNLSSDDEIMIWQPKF